MLEKETAGGVLSRREGTPGESGRRCCTAYCTTSPEICGELQKSAWVSGVTTRRKRRKPETAKLIDFGRDIEAMTKILFICHGNICRSPMAEFVMKDLVQKARLASQFHIESAATSREEIGNPVYPPARRKLAEHGISCEGHTARQLTQRDYDAFDLLIGMDQENLWNIRRICGGDPEGKIHLLTEFAGRSGEVADPWYTGDFEATWRDVEAGCRGLLARYGGD